jgi:hypothetical protein
MKKELVDNLHKAIDMAKNANACAYVTEDGQPCCVAVQFAFLHGVSLETLKSWEGLTANSVQVKQDLMLTGLDVSNDMGGSSLSYLLRTLQQLWDASDFAREGTGEWFIPTDEERRARMHAVIPQPEE